MPPPPRSPAPVERKPSSVLELHVVPNAPRSEVVGRHGSAIKIKLHAPAVDNKANAELIRFLSERLGLSKSALALIRGEKSREKTVSLGTMDQVEAVRILLSNVK